MSGEFYFQFYENFLLTWKALRNCMSDRELVDFIFKSCEYGLYNNDVPLTDTEKLAFVNFKFAVDRQVHKRHVNTENAQKSVEKKTEVKFRPPTIEEVKAYCTERHSTVDAEQFVNFYASKGWKVGKNPMKDWKAAVRTWEQRQIPKTGGSQQQEEMLEL